MAARGQVISGRNIEQQSRTPRSQCSLFKSCCNRAMWMCASNNAKCLLEVKQVIKDLYVHLQNGCQCSSTSATTIAVANSYLEQFYCMFKSATMVLEEQQAVIEKEKTDSESKSKLNDINLKKESRYYSSYTDGANISNFKELLVPLFKSLKMYEKALEYDATEQYMSEKTVTKLAVFENLNALYQIFNYYDLTGYAFQAVDLSLKYIRKYCPNGIAFHPDSENVIIANCNLISLNLKFGCLENAWIHFKHFFGDFNFEVCKITSYGMCLAFLLYCELMLRRRNGKLVCGKLKDFINCEYVSKNTIKRFSIKAAAYLLASRFPPALYKFDQSFCEFIQPCQMSAAVCQRWGFFKSCTSQSGNASDGSLDPMWYRFSVFNLFVESVELTTDFYSNIGLVSDSSYYFKLACSLYVSTLNLPCLSKLQLLGASYDIFNGKIPCAKEKLGLFKQILTTESEVDKSIFNSAIGSGGEDPDSVQEVECIPLNGFQEIEEDESKELTPFEAYQNLISQCSNNVLEDSFETPSKAAKSEDDLLHEYIGEFASLSKHLPADNFKTFFFVYFKMMVLENILNVQDKQLSFSVQCKSLMLLLKMLENFTLKIFKTQLQVLTKNTALTNPVRMSMEEQIVNGKCAGPFWMLTEFYIRQFVAKKCHKEALCFLNKLVCTGVYSFQDRVYRCKMFYFRALVIYKITKHLHMNGRKISKVETNLVINSSNMEGEKTPTPKRITRFGKALNAPTRAGLFKSAVKDYAQSLIDAVSREGTEGTRKVLNFEDDPIIPVTEAKKSKKLSKKCTKTAPRKTVLSSQDALNDLVSNFSHALDLDHSHIDDEESYFGQLFCLNKFLKQFNLHSYTVDEIKVMLRKLNSYIALHPTPSIYRQTQYLYYKLAKLLSKGSSSMLYHLSESMPDMSYRYRSLFLVNRRPSKTYSFDIDRLAFKHDDFGYQDYMNCLPKQWRFVQIKVIENETPFPELLVYRFQSNMRPTFLKIKFNQEKSVEFFMREFEEIMRLNSMSMTETKKEPFWKLRFQIDERLKLLLQSVENEVFGPFKGLFLGKVQDLKYAPACLWFKKKLIELAEQTELKCEDQSLLDVVIESVVFLSTDEAKTAFRILFQTDNEEFLSKVFELKKKYFRAWLTMDKVKELYANLEPVGLILDTPILQFPFESLPTFRAVNQPFFRVPSLRVASLLYSTFQNTILERGVDDKDTYYVIDPSNNLPNTEAFFKTPIKSIKEWNGVIGTQPEGKQLMANLESADIYLYLGHGTGACFFRTIPGGLDSANLKPVSFVIGCSSGRITNEAQNSETHGAPYRFMMNGAPCYVGNLWDVTDRDIDIFSESLMSHWFKRWKPEQAKTNSLAKSISLSRQSCKLKFITGCAPVIYGLPLSNQHKTQT